jgi:hypothetical protein
MRTRRRKENIVKRCTAWAAAALLALVVVALTAAPAGFAKRGDIRVAGTCTGSTTSKIKLSAEDGASRSSSRSTRTATASPGG